MNRSFSVTKHIRSDRKNPNSWKVEGAGPAGKRVRKFFPTRATAEKYAKDANRETRQIGWQAMGLSDKGRIEAAKCYAELAPTGHSLTTAVRFYLTHLAQTERSMLVSDAVEEVIDEKTQLELSKDHLKTMRHHFRVFSKKFGARKVSSISSHEIQVWLRTRKLTPESFKNVHTYISLLFSHCLLQGSITKNPMQDIAIPKIKSKPPGILTPKSMEVLIRLIKENHRDMLVPIVIQCFAGIRRAEIKRLDWREVRITRDYIEVTCDNSKSAHRRLVTLTPNLSALLATVPQSSGRVVPACYDSKFAELRRLLKNAGHAWPKNALRHSFASYYLAQCQDAAKTALQLGHKGTAVLFEHYRELVTPTDATAWFSITPQPL